MKASEFELLLPVGQKEMAEAAIHNGADAIYVGFPGFNARGRSYDFALEELRQIIELCHLYGVKVNLAFNILIFENEIEQVVESLKNVLPLKPDVLIVQDLGLVRIIKEMCPDQVIHGSTQMTVSNDLAIKLMDNLDIKRFVLSRENSLAEIKLIAERTTKELEVFVHGALCVSYSGQCFTSESLGGRSANRGQCAQSCRFSYELIVDGEKKNLIDQNYLVSPQDLCGLSEIPELMNIGVKSFKVEGRLKTPFYVASVAKSFRRAIDSHCQNSKLTKDQIEFEKSKMASEYSRGFFPGWLGGVNHQELVPAHFSSHRGLEIGCVLSVTKNALVIAVKDRTQHLENGDGLLWFDGAEKNGGLIYSAKKLDANWEVSFANSVHLDPAVKGSKIYLNHDRSQKIELEKSFSDRTQLKKIPVQIHLQMQLGSPLMATLTDGLLKIELSTTSLLVMAEKKPLLKDDLFAEFSSLSGTPFQLAKQNVSIAPGLNDGLFLNHREIKILRQKIFSELTFARKTNKIGCEKPVQVLDYVSEVKPHPKQKNKPRLNLLLRSTDQVSSLISAIDLATIKSEQISSVCLDFEFGRDYKKSVEELKARSLSVGIATTRILKPQEFINLKIIHSLNPHFILVRNLGALYYFTQVQKFEGALKGDFSLNVTNHKTFDYLIQSGLSSVCLSYDLNFEQSVQLLQSVDATKAEVTIHQSMPSFHMEHCVFAAFLSKGKSFKDCGKPCEKHKVQLKDQFGHYHWIKPDHECRNTMYNSSAQTALPYLNKWTELGLGEVRFEALNETGPELIQKLMCYVGVLGGKIEIQTALNELKTAEVYGLSPRQLAKEKEYQPLKKDHQFL